MGVTGDSIKIVRYRPQQDPATNATLSAIGADDPPAVVERAGYAFVKYYSQHYETYGRKIDYQIFDGTGESDSEEVSRADAVTIAQALAARREMSETE